MKLEDITIIVPTFHRRGYLKDCLDSLQGRFGECCVVVVSDDGLGVPLHGGYTVFQELPYDSGLAAKRNAGVKLAATKYTLLGSDDFDFTPWETLKGVIEMGMVLDAHPHIDIVAGRVNNRPYEGFLEYVPGKYIKESRLPLIPSLVFRDKPIPVWKVDIAANYFLARTEVLRQIPWDESIRPIGGEHVDWFLDMKAAHKIVAFLPFANIDQMPFSYTKQDPQYRELRRRALTTGHALMMKKRDISQYYGFDEEVRQC